VRFSLLALLLPETTEARGGAQFEGFRLLLARNLYGFVKARFGFALGIGGQGSGIGNLEP
jgi:hypothetical protein